MGSLYTLSFVQMYHHAYCLLYGSCEWKRGEGGERGERKGRGGRGEGEEVKGRREKGRVEGWEGGGSRGRTMSIYCNTCRKICCIL
jgi:hypothetical protein